VLGKRGQLFDLIEIGQHRLAERRQLRAALTSAKQASTELVFQALDRVSQRRLRDAAALCRAREVPLVAEREEITNLMHFHEPPCIARDGASHVPVTDLSTASKSQDAACCCAAHSAQEPFRRLGPRR